MSKKLSLPKDLQQARLDEKWTDLKAIFDAWAAKLTNVSDEIEIYRCLILGESSLEQSLCEKKHQARELGADETFKKSRDYLVQGLQLCNKSIERFGHIAPEFYLLLAKYYYFVDDIINALQSIDKSGITIDNVEELTKRCCILAAEAYCFKGKILEKFSTEKEESSYENAIAAYQLSAELALWIFTDDYKSTNLRKPQETVSHKPMPSGLLTSFCRPVQIELKQGSIHDAIGHCRLFLRIVETNGTVALRKIVAMQLAEMLLFGTCAKNYNTPPLQTWQQQGCYHSGALPFKTYQQRSNSTSSATGRTTPKAVSYSRSTSSSRDVSFCPSDDFEEALLLLLISESLLLRDGCVKLFEKDSEQRQRTTGEMNAIYDLLCLTLTRRQQYGLFLECLERGMKLAYHQFDIWFQYGLALICNKKYKKASIVLKKCLEMREDDLQACLYYVKICINYLNEYEEAVRTAEFAVEKATDPIEKSNFFLALGISYSLMASNAFNYDQAKALRKKSINALEKAHDLDPSEVEILCQLALNHALSRQLAVAATLVNQALQLDPFHRDSLILLSLILSAQSRFQESLEILEIGLREFPDDFQLLQLKVALTEECYSGEQALSVCQEMLELWNETYADEFREAGLLEQNIDGKSGNCQIPLKISNVDAKSTDGSAKVAKSIKSLSFADDVKYLDDEDEVNSITASVKLERSLSEAASTSVSGKKLRIPAAFALLAKIWLITADVYLNMENSDEAKDCIMEASSIFPVSPEVLCMRGRLNYVQKSFAEAKACLDSALAVAPKHIEAMEKLAVLHNETGSSVMAQKYVRDAIAIDPCKPSLWHILGVLMEAAGEEQEASKCLFTSLDLDATHPILPFTIVSRSFKNGDT